MISLDPSSASSNDKWAHQVGVTIRSLEELRALVRADPFGGTQETPCTKRLITLLFHPPTSTFSTLYTSPAADFKILRVSDPGGFSAVTLAENKQSSGTLRFLEREFGKEQTTRNWTTILKIPGVS